MGEPMLCAVNLVPGSSGIGARRSQAIPASVARTHGGRRRSVAADSVQAIVGSSRSNSSSSRAGSCSSRRGSEASSDPVLANRWPCSASRSFRPRTRCAMGLAGSFFAARTSGFIRSDIEPLERVLRADTRAISCDLQGWVTGTEQTVPYHASTRSTPI